MFSQEQTPVHVGPPEVSLAFMGTGANITQPLIGQTPLHLEAELNHNQTLPES